MTVAAPSFDRNRLFYASCIALITTAMTFAIRASILNDLGTQFGLDKVELGICAGTAFWGFTLAMIFGGLLVDLLGMGTILIIALIGHALGIVLTIYATGFWSLFISTLLVGIANGSVEAACNPLVASVFPDRKTQMLNRFHLWFPGGIVIGGVVAYFLQNIGLGWEIKMASILLPTVVYGVMFIGQKFPQTERVTSGYTLTQMFEACVSPGFILMVGAMFLTAATELGTGQWIETLLSQVGVEPILLLVFINGIMAIGRGFAGPVVHKLAPEGMLLFSAIFSAIGLVLLSNSTGGMAFVSAFVFAAGICYFWPTMLGFVAEYMPKTGALGLSIMGGAGMLSVSLILPFMGSRYDANKAEAISNGAIDKASDLAAGSATLMEVAVMPLLLIAVFSYIFFVWKPRLQAKH